MRGSYSKKKRGRLSFASVGVTSIDAAQDRPLFSTLPHGVTPSLAELQTLLDAEPVLDGELTLNTVHPVRGGFRSSKRERQFRHEDWRSWGGDRVTGEGGKSQRLAVCAAVRPCRQLPGVRTRHEMTQRGAIALAVEDARATAVAAARDLRAIIGIVEVLQLAAVIAALTAHHVLERGDYPG